MFVIKSRAITGKLVPALGEHVEYSELHVAIKDAKVLADFRGEEYYVVDGRTDAVVAFIN